MDKEIQYTGYNFCPIPQFSFNYASKRFCLVQNFPKLSSIYKLLSIILNYSKFFLYQKKKIGGIKKF